MDSLVFKNNLGGSDLAKQKEQIGEDCLDMFDYCFSENGLTAFKNGSPLASQSFINFIGQEKYNRLVSFILNHIANLDIPVKTGTFVEFRNGMINVSPVGRNCSHPQRNEFEEYDNVHHIRSTLVSLLKDEFPDYGLTYSIGGQISFDVFPTGWDKTYCLQHLNGAFANIFFFGDKTMKGGNDYEIFSHPDVKGNSVTCPEDTMAILDKLFF